MDNKVKTVAIVTSGLGGGDDRVAENQSIYLSDLGFNVVVLTLVENDSLNFSGKVYYLIKKGNTFFDRLLRFQKLKSIIKKEHVDIVIDHRVKVKWLQELLLLLLTYKLSKTIYVVHSYKIDIYAPNSTLFKFLFSKLKSVVTVSEAISIKLIHDYGLSNTETIYNGLHTAVISSKLKASFKTNEDYVIWYGRIEEKSKNLTLLLEAYKQSKLSSLNVNLKIVGEGPDKVYIQNKIKDLHLENYVELCGYKKNPFPYVANAKFKILTSFYEGLPMVILESLACGIPVISVDCKSGPNEIIRHGENGLLVKQNNVEALAEALNLFIDDKDLHLKCKENSKNSIKAFNNVIIGNHWLELINN